MNSSDNGAHPSTALVLGGGGSRGLAHIGVLEVLRRENVPIDFIVGTSMGGIVGVLYALGLTPDTLAAALYTAMGVNFAQSRTLRDLKLVSARARQLRLREQLTQIVGDKRFDDLQLPVTVMATDMVHGQEVAVDSGDLVTGLLATSAVPGVFPPVRWKGKHLADGGVIDSLATHVAYAKGAARVIAVDVYPQLEKHNPWNDPISAIMGIQFPSNLLGSQRNPVKTPNALASMWRSVRVMTWHLHQLRLQAHPPHLLLRPEVDDIGSLDFKDLDRPIQAGREAAEAQIEALRALAAVNQPPDA